jgi:uncharacterized protein
MKFICDDNLGKLAKYLRFLGFDTFFEEPIDNNELLRLAASQERTLLTRDSHLEAKVHPFGFLLLAYDDPLEQLRAVIANFGLKPESAEVFRRCSLCNELCVDIDKSKAGDKIFPYIIATQEIIRQCPRCRRFYWQGSHYKRIIAELESVMRMQSREKPL